METKNKTYIAEYDRAVKLETLYKNKEFQLLEQIFTQRIIDNVSRFATTDIMPFLSGIKEVFLYVKQESGKKDFYREQTEKYFEERTKKGKVE